MSEETIFDFLQETAEEEFSLPETDYKIRTIQEAERAIAYYKHLKDDIADIDEHIASYMEDIKQQVNNYKQKVQGPLLDKLAFVEERLRVWGEEETQRTGKRSVRLVNGTLSFTRQQLHYEHNDTEILKYINGLAEEHPLRQYLKPQPAKLSWADLKKAASITKKGTIQVQGYDIPSVTVQRVEDAFQVK